MLIPFGGDVDDATPQCPDCLERLVDIDGPSVGAAFLRCPLCGRDWTADELLGQS
jgi:tRNA(Ile2) C34 agmatinyltransferase TiaS